MSGLQSGAVQDTMITPTSIFHINPVKMVHFKLPLPSGSRSVHGSLQTQTNCYAFGMAIIDSSTVANEQQSQGYTHQSTGTGDAYQASEFSRPYSPFGFACVNWSTNVATGDFQYTSLASANLNPQPVPEPERAAR